MSEDLVLQNLKEQKKNAQAFTKRWEGRGNERQDSQSFWLDLLQSVYGIEKPSKIKLCLIIPVSSMDLLILQKY